MLAHMQVLPPIVAMLLTKMCAQEIRRAANANNLEAAEVPQS